MCKSNIISEYIDSCCDCDYEFFRMMMTRYMNKTKYYLLKNRDLIESEILMFHSYYVKHFMNQVK